MLTVKRPFAACAKLPLTVYGTQAWHWERCMSFDIFVTPKRRVRRLIYC
jgi:hypothetical protein